MSKPHRSRTFWPPPLTVAGVGEGHDHRLNRRWKIMVGAWAALTVALAVAVGALFWLLILSDEHAEQERQRIVCALLDSLPEGGPLLDELRGEWGCGPGRPVEDFPPEVREMLRPDPPPVSPPAVQPERPAPSAEADRSQERPPMGGGAVPGPEMSPEPSEPPHPSPAPTEPPLIDLGPVTGGLCEARILCA